MSRLELRSSAEHHTADKSYIFDSAEFREAVLKVVAPLFHRRNGPTVVDLDEPSSIVGSDAQALLPSRPHDPQDLGLQSSTSAPNGIEPEVGRNLPTVGVPIVVDLDQTSSIVGLGAQALLRSRLNDLDLGPQSSASARNEIEPLTFVKNTTSGPQVSRNLATVSLDDDSKAQKPDMDVGKEASTDRVKLIRRLERIEQVLGCTPTASSSNDDWHHKSVELFNNIAISDDLGARVLDFTGNELLAQDMTYPLSETIWEVMPFCNMGLLSHGDVVCVMLSALLNVIAQSIFIGLVATTMIQNVFSDDGIVTTMKDWRILYAHNPDFADAFTEEPLAKTICERSIFRMQGASQADLYNNLHHYTQPFLAVPSGAVLCLLSVLLWTLTCAKECKKVCLFLVGIFTPNDDSVQSFWKGPHRSSYVAVIDEPVAWARQEMQQKNYQLFIAPRRALILAILVGLPRAAILTSLFYVGCLFLVQTVTLSELILNSVALEVIMNLDELVFAILAPAAAVRMVRKTMPLRVPRPKRSCRRFEVWTKIALVAIILVIVAELWLAPMIKNMIDTKRVMCDGDQHFLAAQVSFGPVIVVRTLNISLGLTRQSYKYRAMQQRTGLEDFMSSDTAWQYLQGGMFDVRKDPLKKLRAWRDYTIQDFANLPFGDPVARLCGDASFNDTMHNVGFTKALGSKAWGMGVGSIVGNETGVHSCEDLAHWCFNDASSTGKAVRWLCPTECGSVDPLAGLFFQSAEDGIPTHCAGSFAAALSNLSCQDHDVDRIVPSVALENYAQGFSAHFDDFFKWLSTETHGFNQTHYILLRNVLSTGFQAYGCPFFAKPIVFPGQMFQSNKVSVDFCDPKDPWLRNRRSLRPLCSITCKCKAALEFQYQRIMRDSAFLLAETECPASCAM